MSLDTHSYGNDMGFIRIDGDDIIDGVIDITSVSSAVNGAREVLTYFLKNEDSELAKEKEFNFPIKTREGCRELLVPFASHAGALGAGVYTA